MLHNSSSSHILSSAFFRAIIGLLFLLFFVATARSECLQGVDPSFCQIANATGGSVVVCNKGTQEERAQCMLQAVKNLKPLPSVEDSEPLPLMEHFIYRGHKRNAWHQNLQAWFQGALLPSCGYVLLQILVLTVVLGCTKKSTLNEERPFLVILQPLLQSAALSTLLLMLPALLLMLLPHSSAQDALFLLTLPLIALSIFMLFMGIALTLFKPPFLVNKWQWYRFLVQRILLGWALFLTISAAISLAIGPLYFSLSVF